MGGSFPPSNLIDRLSQTGHDRSLESENSLDLTVRYMRHCRHSCIVVGFALAGCLNKIKKNLHNFLLSSQQNPL
jgi:hypothetical protein